MKKLCLLVTTALLFFLAACSDDALPQSGLPEGELADTSVAATGGAIPGQYIVVLNRGVLDPVGLSAQSAQSYRLSLGDIAADLGVSVNLPLRVINGFMAKNVGAKALERLQNDPRVAYVEQDQLMQASAVQSGAPWGLDRIDQTNLPLSGSYSYSTTASSVTAYIIDTGIRSSHADFGGRVVGGVTAISDGRGSSDCNGHGTHVAGTVGGSTYGVAKGVKLFAVRVLDCQGSGSNSGVIAGVDWVTSNAARPAVANMSLGGGASQALDDAVRASIGAGVTYAVAAGNENQNACNVSPARISSALTVAASTRSDSRASFSNYGSCVDLFAPGQDITSTWYTSNTATNTISGTSMASPHVAGAAALYLQSNPGASPSTVASYINSNASSGVISNTAGSPNRLLFTGTR